MVIYSLLLCFLVNGGFSSARQRSSPFFFVYSVVRSLILGRSVRLKKKKRKQIHKKSLNRRPGTLASLLWRQHLIFEFAMIAELKK